MKFSSSFSGVRAGDIYPTTFRRGDECPPELVNAALEAGALDMDDTDRPSGGPTGAATQPSSLPAGRQRKVRTSRKPKADAAS